MLKSITTFLLKKADIEFPLKLAGENKFPLTLNNHGKVRCPNCGNCTWTIAKYSEIQCDICFKEYKNYGVYGLEELKKEEINY